MLTNRQSEAINRRKDDAMAKGKMTNITGLIPPLGNY